MTDLTQLVADALFHDETAMDYDLGTYDSVELATTALQAVRAQGWRIVKTATVKTGGVQGGPDIVVEEWTG